MKPHAPQTIAGKATVTADQLRHDDLLHQVRRRFQRTLVFAFFITAISNLAVLLVPIYSMEL